MKHSFLILILLFISCKQQPEDTVASYQTFYESAGAKETATYQQTIDFYIRLAKDFPEINIQTIGETDSGYPLHIVTFNPDGDFNFENVRKEKAIILINNGIHPGESDGIDATMLLYRDLATKKLPNPEKTVMVTIPIYNIGGALNRNSTTRANQNGPLEYGFRGNALNYDLNRDFIKLDSKNAKTFSQIFHLVKPDIFIDNHVSNGADYQYTLTHLFTQHNKLGGKLGNYLHKEFMPKIEASLLEKNWDITPYVNVFNRPPELGFNQFLDHPRYSTGYTALWGTLGLMVETHMLKPYKKRVEGTFALMESTIDVAEKEHSNLKKLRKATLAQYEELSQYYFNWQVDTTRTSKLNFKGFEANLIASEVTGLSRLKYNRDEPFTKEISYNDHYFPMDTIAVPAAYIIKQGWQHIMDKLRANHIHFYEIEADTTLSVESYEILDFKTRKSPYEGHYLHYNTQIIQSQMKVDFRAGDFVIPTKQPGLRYLLETLEPQGEDSFFNWNFFDTVLQQKEGFSPYVFEDVALNMLKRDTILRDSFLTKKALDIDFSSDWYAQLDWIYQRSKHREEAYLRYPVYRILKDSKETSILDQQ
ncbi:MAG: M14 family metallopeptidase [Flavobacteriaceae bacterium]